MIAKSLDVVVALKLLADGKAAPYAVLSRELGISASEIHASVHRMVEAGLVDPQTHLPRHVPLQEYLLHGVKYAFPARRGAPTRGIPTSYAAPPLSSQMAVEGAMPPVWMSPDGNVKGYALEPLHPSVPQAIKKNALLYELLALVDAIRDGRARERRLAEGELTKRLALQ